MSKMMSGPTFKAVDTWELTQLLAVLRRVPLGAGPVDGTPPQAAAANPLIAHDLPQNRVAGGA